VGADRKAHAGPVRKLTRNYTDESIHTTVFEVRRSTSGVAPMARERIEDIANLASERLIMLDHLDHGRNLQTKVPEVQDKPTLRQHSSMQDKLGLFRKPDSRKAVIADMELLDRF